MRQRGSTLIELVITLAIIGLLTTAAMPLAQLVAKREKEAQLRTALRDIRTALDAYLVSAQTGHIKQELGATGYPPHLKSLYACVEDQMSEKRSICTSCAASPAIRSLRMARWRRRKPCDSRASRGRPMTRCLETSC